MNKIAIFRTGEHTDMHGNTMIADDAMMNEVVSAYDVKLHESPAVIGHPKHNAPAHGWVKALSFSDGVLYADFDQVDPEFKKMLDAKRLKKRSASFYPPSHAGNPTKGKWYLRHVGFLGALPPAVKGLADFSDDADCPVYEFSDFNQTEEETMSEKNIPDAKPKSAASHTADFAEREAQIAADEKALAAREAKVKADEAAFAQKQEAERKKHFAEFADTLIDSGKVLPTEKDAVVSAFIDVDNADKSFDFAEGGEVKQKSGVQALQGILERLTPAIDFAEHTGTDPNAAERPQHGEGDLDAATEKAIRDFAEQNNMSFVEACDHF